MKLLSDCHNAEVYEIERDDKPFNDYRCRFCEQLCDAHEVYVPDPDEEEEYTRLGNPFLKNNEQF